ncbi:MAG TPA: LemA family protein [Saprospiraceae bacterium]|nr:LemA family protein [Saprospiraceae bacterium]HMV22948.1 LemA family protein [Saprospiraceae bacterium]HMX84546.1 LemA family protein [Saprospiraceae bacterium]HMZ72749.1 LemA family protein [Saprospiraceae bacterium]HNA41093.1 LemA family protein [Saprospiraceae bacterium]
MKSGFGKLFLIGLIAFVLFLWVRGSYNGMVTTREEVNTAWSKVEGAYQRRADLIPNLVNTVKGVANFEQKTLTDVINARASATQVKLDPNNMDEAAMKKFQDSQSSLGGALGRLLVVAENYPQLKATESFRDLQVQLEGTENRINTERNNFNDVAKLYNTNIQKFPANIFASMFGFKTRPYFQAAEGSDKAPTVNF